MGKNAKQIKALTSEDVRQACENAWNRVFSKDATDADNAHLTALAKTHPDEFRHRTDMAKWAAEAMVGTGPNTRPAIRKLMVDRFDQVRQDLGYEHSSVAERLLIDQVAVCYFRMNLAEAEHSLLKASSAERTYREQRLSAIQRRYLRSIETLTRVRKLVQSPVVQVNIATDGGQQVVANSPVSPPTANGISTDSHTTGNDPREGQ